MIRYHNTRMVNYDTHNGFSVSSILMQSDEHHESMAHTATTKHIQIPNATTSHNHKNAAAAAAASASASALASGSATVAGRTKKPTLQTPSISVLTINDVSFLHVGNYTCAPSNAKQASITVHVLRGNVPLPLYAICSLFRRFSVFFPRFFFFCRLV